MDKPKIILLENSKSDANAIAALIDLHYTIVPEIGTKDLKKLISVIAKYTDVHIDPKERQKARDYISAFIAANKDDTKCFIVDYELKEDDNNNNCDGVSFCTDFEAEIGDIPILFFTKTMDHDEILRIKKHVEFHARYADFTFKKEHWKESSAFKEELLAMISGLISQFNQALNKPPY